MADRYAINHETLTGIADAVRGKNHGTTPMTPSQIATAINNLDVEDDYEWRKPPEWPDLESVPLPGSWEENTYYLLYDRSCGVDFVGFSLNRNPTSQAVYKGTIIDGEFVGELVSNNVHNFRDTLTQDYTVYKITLKSPYDMDLNLTIDSSFTRSYSWNNQGLVWVYAEVPLSGSPIGSSGTSLLTPYMKRIWFTHVTKPYFTCPHSTTIGDFGFDTSISFVSGYEEPNDWGGLPVSRTGNGSITPPIRQKSDYIVKNVNFQNSYTYARIDARNVILVNPSGTMKQQQYYNHCLIEKFVVSGGSLKCINMYYQFCSAQHLHTCDMADVDFSECTSWGSAFANCYSLQNLRLNQTCKYSIDLSKCPRLTHESVIGLFNDLPMIESTQKITLNAYTKSCLTDTEIAIATQKGWTVA